MNTEERIRQATEIFLRDGESPDFNLYLQKLKKDDPLAFSILEVYILIVKHQFLVAISRGKRLITRVSGEPRLAWWILMLIGIAYKSIGKMEAGESYLIRGLELANLSGDKTAVSRIKIQLSLIRFSKAEYGQAEKEFLSYRREPDNPRANWADLYLAICAIVKGHPERAIRVLSPSLEADEGGIERFGALEIKAFALRMLGKMLEARDTFLKSAEGYIKYGTAYAVFPTANCFELSRLAGLEPPPRKLIRKSLTLARKGSWGEQAAAEEIEALLREDDAEAAEGLYEAAKNYLRAYQNIEAVFSGLTAAYLAWKADSPVFTKALKLIAPLVPLHPGFKKDPLLGDFMAEIEPFITKALKPSQDKERMRAYLIGELRVLVDGKEIKMKAWRNNKAIKTLLYLLLSPKHRIPTDHLFYLLWPRRSYNKKSRWCLYKAVDTARKHLGRRELLTKSRDFYQLEDTWTDLGEIENLVRLADATTDPAQKEEYLARARELAKGELLPEFPYDKHIEEYREYYERLRKRILGNKEP